MAWVLLDDNFPNHPKAVAAGPVASYLFVCGLCYCRRFHTDGLIPRKALPMLGVTNNPRRMVDALVECGLWDVDEASGGWRVHGYEEFYQDADDKARKESRRESGRKGGIESRRLNKGAPKQRGEGTGLVIDLQEEKVLSAFDAFWSQYPKKDGKQAALDVWRKLNPDDVTQQMIAEDVARRSRGPQWTKDGGQFIPHARTYLHQKRWQDGYAEAPKPQISDSVVEPMKAWLDAKKASGV